MNLPAPLSAASRSIHSVANLVIVLVLVLFGIYVVNTWQQVRAREEQHMASNLSLLKRTLDIFFLSKRAGLMSLIDAIERSPGQLNNLAAIQPLLAAYKQHRPEITLTFLTDMQGQFLASSHTQVLQGLPTIGDQPSFQAFLQEYQGNHDLYIGRPQLGKLTGQWSFSLRYVLRDRQGQPMAVLTDVFPTDFLDSLWKSAPLVQHLTVGLLRDDGYLLSRYPLPETVRKEEIFGTPRNGALFQNLVRNGFPSRGQVSGANTLAGGEDYLNLYSRLDSYPVTVFIAQAQRQIRNACLASIVTPLVLVLLLLSLVKLVSWRLAREQQQREQERAQGEAQLRASETEQRMLIDNLMTGVVVHDASGAVLRCNREASNLLGLIFEQMTGKQLIDPSWRFLREDGSVMPVDEYPASQVLKTRTPIRDLAVGIIRSQDAAVCWVLCRADPWFDVNNALEQIVVTFVDITMRRQLSTELRDRELKFKALFDNSMDAVLLTSPEGAVLSANQAACELFRMSEAQIIAQGLLGLVDADDPQLEALLARRRETGRAAGLLTMVRGDGQRFTAEISSSIYNDSHGHAYSSMIVRDISERMRTQAELEAANAEMRRVNEQLADVAHYDMLTHLPNRVLLSDRLQQAMAHAVRRGKPLAVAFLDLDGFKDINDRYGHATGDEFLVAISRRMKLALREGDTLARIGGDEFIVVLTDLADEHDCEPLLRRLLALAAEPLMVVGRELQVSASIGVTIYPQDRASPEQLIRHADQAMYLAKQAGKNRYHLFDVVSDAAIRTKRESLAQLMGACERQEFVLHYQPQVDMLSGEVVGLEALIRGQHPQRGLLAPAEFLPVVEDQTLAIAIGEQVMAMAMAQMARWQTQDLALPVSVNLFTQQLQQGDFVDKLRHLLAAYPSVPPDWLELEIVETSALQDIALVSQLMHDGAALGVRFALDDFGTGYSSLTYLKKLPAAQLKIDQSFVRDMLDDQDDLAIVQGVIGLSQAFGRQVIAEGVETVEHGRLLLSLGCRLAQGYGVARPMPASEVPVWLTQWQARQPWISP